mgnify:FL=1
MVNSSKKMHGEPSIIQNLYLNIYKNSKLNRINKAKEHYFYQLMKFKILNQNGEVDKYMTSLNTFSQVDSITLFKSSKKTSLSIKK